MGSVIINPDKFAEQAVNRVVSRYGQRYQAAVDRYLLGPDIAAHRIEQRARRSRIQRNAMCEDCMGGKHELCVAESCTCVHRAGERFNTTL